MDKKCAFLAQNLIRNIPGQKRNLSVFDHKHLHTTHVIIYITPRLYHEHCIYVDVMGELNYAMC